MTTQKELQLEYDRIVEQTLRKLKKTKPLTKQKLAKALFDANKAYWTARLFIIDNSAVNEAENVAIALAAPYANAAQTFSDRVRNIYAGYESAFSLTHKDAKELLDKVVYDRTIAENLKTVAEGLTDEEEKRRILAEISAPAYRYRLQRAEKLTEQAQSVCDTIAKREARTDRAFLQTQTEKAYNITIDDVKPSDAILESIEPIQLRFNEMPKASEPVQDFTPTTDKGVLDSFSLVSESNVREIVNTDWSGHEFSERIWNNTGELANEVKQVLIEGELTGASEADMAAKIAERFQVGMHKARRVVRTEQNYCINQAEMKGLKDAGYDSYLYCSLHEERDCDICDALDGKVFKFADAAVGINMPPIHPFCRCRITAPEETLEDLERELDEMIDSWNIPEGMSLDEFIDRVNNGELEQIREEQEKSAESVDFSEKSGIMKVGKEETTENDMLTGVFHTYDDPMREVMGSAIENNPEELNAVIEDLRSIGVETVFSDNNESIGYQPCNRFFNGEPGQVKLTRESSLSACLHERQHAFDDYESGWKGRYILSFDPEEHFNWEVKAYGVEIDIAKSMGREDMVERLESLLERERKAIFYEE